VVVLDGITARLVGDVSNKGLLQLTGLFKTERINSKVIDNKVTISNYYKGCTDVSLSRESLPDKCQCRHGRYVLYLVAIT
jgi:hypothetical protein